MIGCLTETTTCVVAKRVRKKERKDERKKEYFLGNHPYKFQLIGINRFGGVREQTDSLTHSLTD